MLGLPLRFWGTLLLGSSVIAVAAIATTTTQGMLLGFGVGAAIVLAAWWRWQR